MSTGQFKKEQVAPHEPACSGPAPVIKHKIWIALGQVFLAWFLISASAQTLYEGALNRLPSQEGWVYGAYPGGAVQTLGADAVRLDTSIAAEEQAGYARTTPIALDREAGFTILFTVRVERESHGSADRAGFSVIVLGHDQRGIELGFWTNAVFAQADLPLFTHAEEALCDTASAFVDYALTLGRDRYELRAGGQRLLEGPVRDYTAFSGSPSPYETLDFVFLGDDTTSACGVVSIRRVVVVPAPVLQIRADGLVTWTGVTNVPYTVQASADLGTWISSAPVTSATGHFTSGVVPSPGGRFLRVAGP